MALADSGVELIGAVCEASMTRKMVACWLVRRAVWRVHGGSPTVRVEGAVIAQYGSLVNAISHVTQQHLVRLPIWPDPLQGVEDRQEYLLYALASLEKHLGRFPRRAAASWGRLMKRYEAQITLALLAV